MRAPLALALLLAAAPAAAQCVNVDLSSQFPDAATRDQCDIGSCHAFGAVGLLEAAIYRQHGRRVRLSEADLFAARIGAADGLTYDQIMAREEGNFLDQNLRFALANGVAYAEDGDYEAAAARYDQTSPQVNRARTTEVYARLKPLLPNKWAVRVALAYERKRDAKTPMAPADMEREILGGDEAVARARAQRAEVKALLAGFRLEERGFIKNVVDGKPCRDHGAPATRAISALLCRARPVPVALGMALDGLADWGMRSATNANHAFIVSGLRVGQGGTVFQTRNSWGGNNPPVRDFETCRVFRAYAVMAPVDDRPVPPASGGPLAVNTLDVGKVDSRAGRIASGLKPDRDVEPLPESGASPQTPTYLVPITTPTGPGADLVALNAVERNKPGLKVAEVPSEYSAMADPNLAPEPGMLDRAASLVDRDDRRVAQDLAALRELAANELTLPNAINDGNASAIQEFVAWLRTMKDSDLPSINYGILKKGELGRYELSALGKGDITINYFLRNEAPRERAIVLAHELYHFWDKKIAKNYYANVSYGRIGAGTQHTHEYDAYLVTGCLWHGTKGESTPGRLGRFLETIPADRDEVRGMVDRNLKK